ncbi:MAG: putative intracellular protease/amidase [Crocinitomix sp.]|jgi:putative intracellular protease/amidase
MKSLTVLAFALFSAFGNPSNLRAQEEKDTTVKKVLFVLTSHEDLGETGRKTGFWLEEFTDPYYLLIDNGIEVTLVSPKGGRPPIDPSSATESYQTESTIRFASDTLVQKLLSNTVKIEAVNAADYDAVFYPGGHGPLWDLAEDKNSIALIEYFFNANKPIAVACHAPAIFKNTKKPDGTPLVKGLKVTGFSNSEEAASGLAEVVPFLVEDMLTENGAIYSKGPDWAPFVVEDGSLITGQNPASAKIVAEKLLEKLK